MPIETGNYISDLNASNPLAGDPKSQGDDHIRLIKAILKATFPNVAGAVTTSHTELSQLAGATISAFAKMLLDDSDAATACGTLGATTVGQSIFTAANPSAITFLRVNADNTASFLSASDFRTAIGAGSGNGDFLANGTVPMTGNLQLNAGLGIVFEGTTADNYETTLRAGNPTADRVVTLPNATTTLAGLTVAQSFLAQQTFKELKDTVHTITDGAAFEIDPANGSIQVVTLGASRTPAATNFEAGQTVLLGIDDGTAYTVTWTTVNPTWVKPGGTASAPTLATSGYTWVLLWKVGSTIYATEVGKP